MSYHCAVCGKTHDGLPDLAFRWPDPYFGVPEAERDIRIKATSDICSIDDEDFFIRGVLLIPIKGEDLSLGLGVWVSQKRENFEAYVRDFNSADIGPFFGWLCNRIPFYQPETWALKTMAHFQGGNRRPLIRLEPGDHPLCRDSAEGINMDRAWAIVHAQSSTGS